MGHFLIIPKIIIYYKNISAVEYTISIFKEIQNKRNLKYEGNTTNSKHNYREHVFVPLTSKHFNICKVYYIHVKYLGNDMKLSATFCSGSKRKRVFLKLSVSYTLSYHVTTAVAHDYISKGNNTLLLPLIF